MNFDDIVERYEQERDAALDLLIEEVRSKYLIPFCDRYRLSFFNNHGLWNFISPAREGNKTCRWGKNLSENMERFNWTRWRSPHANTNTAPETEIWDRIEQTQFGQDWVKVHEALMYEPIYGQDVGDSMDVYGPAFAHLKFEEAEAEEVNHG